MLFPPRPLDEIQTNLVCESLKKNWACNSKITLGPAPWDPEEGSKDQKSLNYNDKVNSKVFCAKLCLFLQIKDIKHIERDFFLMPGSCPRGVTLGSRGCTGGQNGNVAYQIDRDDE